MSTYHTCSCQGHESEFSISFLCPSCRWGILYSPADHPRFCRKNQLYSAGDTEWMKLYIKMTKNWKNLFPWYITWTFPSLERIPCFFISLWSSSTDTNPSLFWSSLINSPRNWSMIHPEIKHSAIWYLYNCSLSHLLHAPQRAGKQCICNIHRVETCRELGRWVTGRARSSCRRSILNGSLWKRHVIAAWKTADGAMAARSRVWQCLSKFRTILSAFNSNSESVYYFYSYSKRFAAHLLCWSGVKAFGVFQFREQPPIWNI